MKRLFRLSLLTAALCLFSFGKMFSADVQVSGEIDAEHIRIFVKDSTYILNRDYKVYGTLIVEPGTTVKFQADGGRLIVMPGGRVIADGMANANYVANPDGRDPIATPGSSKNPESYSGYADLDYFFYSGDTSTVNVTTKRDVTVNPAKYDHIFNVVMNKNTRRVVNLTEAQIGQTLPSHLVKISPEEAVMFKAARLEIDPVNDINLNINPWQRLNYKSVDVEKETITFQGLQINDFSREWGHIVVLPGARAAFFRDVVFENFMKDTTVDRANYYTTALLPDLNQAQIDALNKTVNKLTNGGGGAITTMSSRTWLLNCEFTNNTAIYRGGALQLLQAPYGFPMDEYNDLGYYASNKNPNITDNDGQISSVIRNNPVLAIDMIDEATAEPLSNYDRQAYDDARLALYLGRMRNLKFEENKLILANVEYIQVGPYKIVKRNTEVPAYFPHALANHTKGGAIFMAGRQGDEDRQIEVAFGINNSVMIDGEEVEFEDMDTFEAISNSAENYQEAASTEGARGGAIYVGRYTSLIATGNFSHNRTWTKFLTDDVAGSNSGWYSMGGAIFTENSMGRLQLRGGPERENVNETVFYQNEAGAGGAIFVDGNADPQMSPIIGGSDVHPFTRDYGFNILFKENTASCFGGAVFSKRNMMINGAGGVDAGTLIGYGGNYPIRFEDNRAGYAGGALNVTIPNAAEIIPAKQRIVNIVRAEFVGNIVGEGIDDTNKPEIRGGGAIYALSADLNVVKATEFRANKVYNGNGGALCLVHPVTSAERFFLSDLDQVILDENGVATSYESHNGVFTFEDGYDFNADQRMLTRFLDNEIMVDQNILDSQSGTGTTQVGKGTLPTSADLYATTWLDANNGWAVGYNGTIVKLTNGGTHWEYKHSGTRMRLNDVEFTNSMNGYAAGDKGVMLRTTDGGNTWTKVMLSTDKNINDIDFVGTNVGYAVTEEGYFMKTTDAGNTWSITKPQMQDLNAVSFTGTDNGYVVGDRGTIIATTDGGSTWNVQTSNTIVNLNDIYFVDANNGYIAGNAGVILSSNNAGATWTDVPTTTADNLYTVNFTTTQTGFIGGTFGTLFTTTDAGANWTEVTNAPNENLNDIFFSNKNVGFAVGNYGVIMTTTDAGANWSVLRPDDESEIDVVRYHEEIRLPENGVGLGGALYLLDSVNTNRLGRVDTVQFNRVRFQNNKSYTGAAIYSDNFDLKLILNRSLVNGNEATSEIGAEQNYITGPIVRDATGAIEFNQASHDLAGAIIYGEVQGPLPSHIFSEAANSIYNNNARFLFRLPDAPNTKGVLAGTTGIGFGGTDTLRGNYWGHTEANVNLVIKRSNSSYEVYQETFFLDSDGTTHLPFLHQADPADPRTQGPFEFNGNYTYQPVPLTNGADENTVGDNSIPEKLLMSGHIYDSYDKGTDIKTADYSKRRMSPIEDFAVGVPPVIRRFDDDTKPSNGKYVKRWIRDPFVAEALDTAGALKFPYIAAMQDEFGPDKDGKMWHPVGQALYLEAMVDYDGIAEVSNHDERMINQTIYFVVNETTGDFIRVNMDQVAEQAPYRETFRTRVELVPDSTNRNPNTLIRRTAEGLLNLGTKDNLLRNLEHNPYNEDQATLGGRKYTNYRNMFANTPNLLKYRDINGDDSWPADNMDAQNQEIATYFAGERFGALPVKVGDEIRVVSRTVLWREGVIPAFEDGITFEITREITRPEFTGDIVTLKTDTIWETRMSEKPDETDYETYMLPYLNTIFVTEDREYPVEEGEYSVPFNNDLNDFTKGRDSILRVTAIDLNNYYDPRSYKDPENFARLTYHWEVAGNSALKHWLFADYVKAQVPSSDYDEEVEGAIGYLQFYGKPINPFVVPGGEEVKVWAENYPAHWRTVDILKDHGQWSDEEIANYINIYKPYLSNPAYDTLNARYLQQDTIDVAGENYMSEIYSFRLYVTDSLPKFIGPDEAEEIVERRVDIDGTMEEYVTYKPTFYAAGRTLPEDGSKVIASMTDKLRFMIDINTDDEAEDDYAESVNWDFRYGKTAYGFMNIGLRLNPEEEVVIDDDIIVDNDGDGIADDVLMTYVKPVWFDNKYFYEYGQEVNTDEFGTEWKANGQLNIRIDKAEAEELLKPKYQYNDELNLDTNFVVVVNDGHGGVNTQNIPVYVNVAPTIITDQLENAKEDIDYNPELLDLEKMIKVYDPNMGEEFTFELIYPGDPRDEIAKDPFFQEAGVWDISGMKTTPEWLKINENSGLLYGTPGIHDSEKDELVTVLVTDKYGLTHVKQFNLHVDPTNHAPDFVAIPEVDCAENGQAYEAFILIWDYDLLSANKNEKVTITVDNGLQVDPASVSAPQADTVQVRIFTDNLQVTPGADGKVEIKVTIVDADDEEKTITYKIKVSNPTYFTVPMTISNNTGSQDELIWGVGDDATTGEGTDGEEIGTLDEDYCEFQLPPLPPEDVFDVRWNISSIPGSKRNIFPLPQAGLEGTYIYKLDIQPGGENGQAGTAYPVVIRWNKTDIPEINDATRNPRGSSWFIKDRGSQGNRFRFNMIDALNPTSSHYNSTQCSIEEDGDYYVLTIKDDDIDAVAIMFDWASPVQGGTDMPAEVSVVNVTPNPIVNAEATVTIGLPNAYNDVKVELFDAIGNKVADIDSGVFSAGYHDIKLSGKVSELSNGTYQIKLTAGGITTAYPIVILK